MIKLESAVEEAQKATAKIEVYIISTLWSFADQFVYLIAIKV